MAHLISHGKRGILLTLGLIFVSLTILAFGNVILNNSETSESRIKEFAETERMYNIETSISKSVSKMKYALDDNLLEIDQEEGRITIKTTFSNKTFLKEEKEEIKSQMEIFANRTKPFVNFDDFPLFGESVAFFDGAPPFLVNSSRFYLRHTPHMYIEFITYPYNSIYLNGFNTSNTVAINFTYRSDKMVPLNVTQHAGGIPSSCSGQSCINVSFKNYFGLDDSDLRQNTSFSLEEMDIEFVEPIFEINLSSSEWTGGDKNRTLAFNWVNLTSQPSVEGTSEGLMIMLPEISVIQSFKNYYLYTNQNNLNLIDEYAEIEIIISLKPETDIKSGFFMDFVSPTVYNISYPKLETSAEDLRIHYLG